MFHSHHHSVTPATICEYTWHMPFKSDWLRICCQWWLRKMHVCSHLPLVYLLLHCTVHISLKRVIHKYNCNTHCWHWSLLSLVCWIGSPCHELCNTAEHCSDYKLYNLLCKVVEVKGGDINFLIMADSHWRLLQLLKAGPRWPVARYFHTQYNNIAVRLPLVLYNRYWTVRRQYSFNRSDEVERRWRNLC